MPTDTGLCCRVHSAESGRCPFADSSHLQSLSKKIEIATALQNLIFGTHRRNLAADKVEVAHPIEVGVVGDTGCAVAGAALGSAP